MANQEIITNGAAAVPPPLTHAEIRSIFRLLTEKKRKARFEKIISRRDEARIIKIASFMETNPNDFVEIVGTKKGSTRVQKLFGLSHEANGHFCKAITSRFVEIMKDNHAFSVVAVALMALGQDQQKILLELTLFHVIDLAKHEHGCVGVNMIITHSEYLEYKNQIMDRVAEHAHELSTLYSGAYVVTSMLKLDTFTDQSMGLLLFSLRGRCVELSFTEPGSYVVNQLLEGTAESVNYVVEELRSCTDNNMLVSLAEDKFGNYVVYKALQVTATRADSSHLFTPLVLKLGTIHPLLGNSRRGNKIRAILDGTVLP